MFVKKSLFAIVISAATCALGIVPGQSVAQEVAPAQCSKVEIIVTAGTGQARENDDPTELYEFNGGTPFVKEIVAKYPEVSAWQTPYPASLGIAGTFGDRRSEAAWPYGTSKNYGVEAIVDHLNAESVRCPNQKYVLTGYSQGADVTGAVAAEISAGRTDVDPERLIAAYLFADPQRSPITDQFAETVSGVSGRLTEAGAILIPLDQGVPAIDTVGLAGTREAGAFQNVPGKVIQLCLPEDIACASKEGGFLTATGGWAMALDPVPYQHDLAELKDVTCEGLLLPAVQPVLGEVLLGMRDHNSERIRLAFRTAAHAPGLGESEGASISLLGEEIAGVWDRLQPILSSDLRAPFGEAVVATKFGDAHGSYFRSGQISATIGGVRADDWVHADMANVIAVELGQEPDNVAPVKERDMRPKLPDINKLRGFCAPH